MNKMKYNKIKFALSAAVMGIMAGNVQAIELIRFSNGNVADANDVNHNFNLLEKRIEEATKLSAPIGGVRGIKFHSWVGFNASVGWLSKTFVVAHSNEAHDKEVRTFEQVPAIALPGFGAVEVTRERTLQGAVVSYDVLSYTYSLIERSLDKIAIFETDTITLNRTNRFDPGIKLQHDAMGEGLNWATAATVSSQLAGGGDPTITFTIENRSLLKVEDITVLGFAYKACQKILVERSNINVKIVNWYCPSNVGLVKQIFVMDGTVSKLLEFDRANSTPRPASAAGNGGTTNTLTLGSTEPGP
ncbi:hypothetical protein MNBD_GAMMA07-2464 [hydrothermal vent metagenome]|uniref:Uncharacterized protein n=1 Tax=hydrothermal vent metagenome TaxID=652676 RepID=A0A3B0WWT4_9ZZZZ